MVDRRRPPTALWDPLAVSDGPLSLLSRWKEAPRVLLSVSAITVAIDHAPPYVPVPAITGERLRETEEVLSALGVRDHAGFAVLAEAPAGADVAERALAGLGTVDPTEPFYLVRSGPGTDPFVAALPGLVHQFGLGDDLGVTHLDELGGLALFELLSWAVPANRGAVALVVDQPVYVPGDATPAAVSAVALRVHRGDGPLRVRSWGDGEPPITALAAARRVFGGPGPCDAWLALHDAVHSNAVRDGDRVLLCAGGGDRAAWAELEINDSTRLHLEAS
jgi:hypothetical protein